MTVGSAYRVFISHASEDTWVARQLAVHIEKAGGRSFLDAVDIERGDDFEDRILAALEECDELLVLFTKPAVKSRYVWLEIGKFWGRRITAALHGISIKEIQSDAHMPVLLKRTNLVHLNEIDAYFAELGVRIEQRGKDVG